MKTRQQNTPSEYEESEEAERLDSESSDDLEYAPASEENSSEDNDQAHEDSPSSSRGTGAIDKISTSVIPRPSNALSDNSIQVVFHLNPPKHALSEVFSPQQLSQQGLQSLAQVDLLSNMVTPDKLLQMERSATLTTADAINTIHGAQKMHAVTYESMYEELLDTHQRVYDRDVEKAALFDRNRILNRQVKDLMDVISSLHLQLREAQEQLQQKSVVTIMGIPTTYSGGVSMASHTLTGSHEQTEAVTSMPLPPHGVFTCPLPDRPSIGASIYAPSMPATPFVSSSAPIQPHPNIYSSHFGTLPQYNMQLPTPHHLPSPSQALVSSSVSLQPNLALYSSHFGTLPGYHMAIPPPSHLLSPSQVQLAYSLYPNIGFNPYNPLPYNYPPAPYPSFYAPPPTQSSSPFYPPPPPPSSSSEPQ
ncbi:hypothetical protein L7F22_003883 [Adiantum nelumboides]|nr:hypothetical protein [Adiantum nelumboides]